MIFSIPAVFENRLREGKRWAAWIMPSLTDCFAKLTSE
jgi:hypothetical protein